MRHGSRLLDEGAEASQKQREHTGSRACPQSTLSKATSHPQTVSPAGDQMLKDEPVGTLSSAPHGERTQLYSQTSFISL